MPRVLHLVGSAQSEFMAELSRLYAGDCLQETAECAEAVIAYVSPDRRWSFPSSLDEAALDAAPAVPVAAAVEQIGELGIDAMLPQMFCLPGMTEYRALFDVLEIPYLGNRAETMALTAHKARAKAVVAAAGVAVPAGEVLRDGEAATLIPPVVVKPVDADNSAGVSLVRSAAELEGAVREAHAASPGAGALVEEYVPLGREVRCGVLERDGELVVLPLEEYAVSPRGKPIRDAADKLGRGENGVLALMAKDAAHAWIVDPADPVCEAVGAAARRCYAALGCRHYGLFDFRVDPGGRPWFLEAGLYCSFARQSVVAVMARAAGIELDVLFHTVLDSALREASIPAAERSLDAAHRA